jgi:hypothetical protein
MHSSCKIYVLSRSPKTYPIGMALLTVTACHIDGQYVALLVRAVVCLLFLTREFVALQSPASLSSSGTIIEVYLFQAATALRTDGVYFTEKGYRHGLTTFSHSYRL